MKAADTSVVIAAFASWHEHHDRARDALDEGLRVIDHCALETYSVLTRLPPPHRCAAAVVRDFLRARFVEPFLRLEGQAFKDFVLELPDHAVTGGGAYDALVAATASTHSASLITCDRRASLVYESYGVQVVFIG